MFTRTLPRAALAVTSLLAVIATITGVSAPPARAAVPDPSLQETARLLGYMWADGAYADGVWDVNGPSGTASLIEELVEAHGGTWVDRQRLRFRLVAPYDWVDWKDALPDDDSRVRDAVKNHHFLAAVMEAEASVDGQIYDQSACCVDGFTRGRLTALRDMMRERGFTTTTLVTFNNEDSGKITVASSEWDDLRASHRFVCPVEDAAIRIPGGSNHAAYGNLRWFNDATRWSDLVRTECESGEPVPDPVPQVGSCWVTADGDRVTVAWSFTLGDANVRRNGSFLETVAGRYGSTVDYPGDGTHTYQVRLNAFGTTASADCGSVTVGDGGGVDGPCSVSDEAGNVRVSWDDFGVDTYQIRRNGSWAATVDDATTVLLSGSVNDSWVVRYRAGGVVTDVPCGAGGPVAPCTVTTIAQGRHVDWLAVDGVTSFQVRRDGSWIATVSGATEYIDTDGGADSAYEVRYRRDGRTITIQC